MPPSTPRVLIVAVDRLPAWIVPAYGATWVSMPALLSLAGRGVVFDRVIATSDDHRRTLADIVAGQSGAVLVTDDPQFAVAERSPGLELRLVAAAAKAEAEPDAAATNLGRLFAAAAEAVAGGARSVVVHATALGVAWDAPEELVEAYQDPDDPPPPPGATVPELTVTAETDPDLLVGIRHVFAAQLTLLDHCLEALLAAAGEGPWTILVVGLRGIGLGLHGLVGAGDMPPFSELVHVPAVLVDSRERMAAQRFGGLVTPADLGATLRDLDGRAPAADTTDCRAGRSLAALFADWSATSRDRVVSVARGGVAVATAGWHAVAPRPAADGAEDAAPPLRLFAKPDDFFELCDVADRCPTEAEELGGLVAAVAAGDEPRAWSTPLSAESRFGHG